MGCKSMFRPSSSCLEVPLAIRMGARKLKGVMDTSVGLGECLSSRHCNANQESIKKPAYDCYVFWARTRG
jgi:hypothetical protein